MKHAPATFKGWTRRAAVIGLEIMIGAAVTYGALLIICSFITRLEIWMGVY